MDLKFIARDICDIFVDFYLRSVLLITNAFPGRPGNIITETFKKSLLGMIGIHCKSRGQISCGFYVFKFGNICFGDRCSVGFNFKVWNFNRLIVGDRLLASHNITVICGTHMTNAARTNIPGPIFIGDNVWIGANVLIVGPATIGSGSIIGANSFVTGDVMPNWIYAGNPAKPIRSLT